MNTLKKAKGLEIKKVEIFRDMPFFQVYRNYEKSEMSDDVLDDINRKKKLPIEERKNLIPHKKLIGQFNSQHQADEYVTLIMESQETDLFYWVTSYSDLGYDISLTALHGKDAVRMVKRYSHKAERALTCEQIQRHEDLKHPQRLQDILQYLYNDIQKQEQTGNYYEPF